jgi:hypothetical protein
MLAAAKARSFCHTKSQIGTTSSWIQLVKTPAALDRAINVLVNATYLFSSASLEVNDVCEAVMGINQLPHVRRLLFSGEKFRDFKKELKGKFTSDGLKECERVYHKRRSSLATSKTEFVRQLLVFKDDA